RFSGVSGDVDLTMASWTPGSYLIRDYARHVQEVAAIDAAGRPLAVTKGDKATWRVAAGGADEIVVRYRVYAWELSVRTNHVDAPQAFVNGAPTYLWIPSRRSEPHAVEVAAPEGWRFTTALAGDGAAVAPGAAGHAHWVAADVDELVDSPLLGHAGETHEI